MSKQKSSSNKPLEKVIGFRNKESIANSVGSNNETNSNTYGYDNYFKRLSKAESCSSVHREFNNMQLIKKQVKAMVENISPKILNPKQKVREERNKMLKLSKSNVNLK